MPGHPTRRQFLRSSCALLALPWLETFAAAGSPAAPRRMVNICTSFGLYGPSFFPQGSGRDYQPGEYLQVLAGLREHFTVFSGISHPEIGGDHASEACFLTSAPRPRSSGFRNTVSLDYLAAQQVGSATRFPLLSLCTQDGGTLTHSPNGSPLPALWQPAEIFRRLFLSGDPNEVKQEISRLQRGQSILDHMGDRFAALKRQLSVRDQLQVNDYTDAVRDLEKQMHADEVWVTRPKPQISEKPPGALPDRADNVARFRLLLNLTKLALQTDSTRVVSIFVRGMDLRPPIDGVSEDHHGLSHHGRNPEKIAQLRLIELAEMAALRDFLSSLHTTSEGSSTLLEQTQVLFGSNLGDASSHNTNNLPILLAGGGFRHGQHLAGEAENNTPLGRLFVSMLQRFGVEAERFGSGAGTLKGLAMA